MKPYSLNLPSFILVYIYIHKEKEIHNDELKISFFFFFTRLNRVAEAQIHDERPDFVGYYRVACTVT